MTPKLVQPFNITESTQEAGVATEEVDETGICVYEFLTNNIKQRFMALDNQCESDYQKNLTREALIEMIDVVQTANRGSPFTNAYFDKATKTLIQRKEKEEETRGKFLEEEINQWRDLLGKAEEVSNQISENHWKGVQQKCLQEEQGKEYANLKTKTLQSLDDLEKGFAVLKGLLMKTTCVSLWDVQKSVHRRLDELSKVKLSTTYAHMPLGGGPLPLPAPQNDSYEVITEVREDLKNSLALIRNDNLQDIAFLQNKIFENEELQEELGLALAYATEAASGAAESHLRKMGVRDLKRENTTGFAVTKKTIKDNIIQHICLVEIALGNSSQELEPITKQIAKAVTNTAVDKLKEKLGWFRWRRVDDEKPSMMPYTVHTDMSTKEREETELNSAKQAIDFLLRRQLNCIKQQAIQAECDKTPFYHHIILHGGVKKDEKEKYLQSFANIPEVPTGEDNRRVAEEFKARFAELFVKKLLLELEEDSKMSCQRQQSLDECQVEIRREKETFETKIADMTNVLINVVCGLAPSYAMSLNKDQLKEIETKNYSKAAKDLSQKVTKELEKENKQLQNETKAYFQPGDRISKAIKIYAKLNHDTLVELAKEVEGVCFPAEATVTEERRGTMKICDVRVGDRLLTTDKKGAPVFEEIFMLGKFIWQNSARNRL